LTRNSNSAAAKQLKQKYGDTIEFVQGSYLERSSLEKLFDGAYYAFIVTNFWVSAFYFPRSFRGLCMLSDNYYATFQQDPQVRLKEEELGKLMADVTKAK